MVHCGLKRKGGFRWRAGNVDLKGPADLYTSQQRQLRQAKYGTENTKLIELRHRVCESSALLEGVREQSWL